MLDMPTGLSDRGKAVPRRNTTDTRPARVRNLLERDVRFSEGNMTGVSKPVIRFLQVVGVVNWTPEVHLCWLIAVSEKNCFACSFNFSSLGEGCLGFIDDFESVDHVS
jgi:hypothetical protein